MDAPARPEQQASAVPTRRATTSMSWKSFCSIEWTPEQERGVDGTRHAILRGTWPGGDYAMTFRPDVDEWHGLPDPDESSRETVVDVWTRRAALVASLAHKDQVDKIGEPYIGHPARVAEAVRAAVGDGLAVQAAFLHDVVEDTELTLDDLLTFGFGENVVNVVDALTKRKGETVTGYYERVKANPIAVVVKWYDIADNTDAARLARVEPVTRERLRAKYERAKAALRAE